jgi:hypothetical protein
MISLKVIKIVNKNSKLKMIRNNYKMIKLKR